METRTFTIKGNQDDPDGNPIPYHRTTQGSFWNKGSRRYAAWKSYVQKAYCTHYEWQGEAKPISKLPVIPRGKITAQIAFKGEAHADADNIVKGICDALFDNDKEMDVATEHTCKNERGEVKVTIEII